MSETVVRPHTFADRGWYPAEASRLTAMLEAALPQDVERAPARAVIAPHAGYRYSLAIAAETYARVEIPQVVVVLCPNHSVPPPIISVWPRGTWRTPLGDVPVDEELTRRILETCPDVVAETGAHVREHAVEMHVPILRHLRPDLRLVAMVVATPSYEALERLGLGLAQALEGRDDVLLVASTDMTHHLPAEAARSQDERALAHVTAMDAPGLLELCTSERISMCGVRPTTAVLVAAKRLGATRVELVRYGNSAETSGDTSSVVGYAGLVVR